jgi:plasmid stabilization system protein ParE
MNRVELAPRAHAQVRLIDEWWRANRLSAPNLFADELASALEQLERGVAFGVVYPFPLFEVRRFLLPRSRYHVFYSVDGDLVKVRAVWHASRGKGPPLR